MTGLIPAAAAPSPAPINPASAMGVFITLSSPNSSTSPLVHPKIPPSTFISSPITNTSSSLLISSAIVSLIACAYDFLLILSLLHKIHHPSPSLDPVQDYSMQILLLHQQVSVN